MFPRLASLSGVAFPRWTDYSGGLTPADKTVLYANENLLLSLSSSPDTIFLSLPFLVVRGSSSFYTVPTSVLPPIAFATGASNAGSVWHTRR